MQNRARPKKLSCTIFWYFWSLNTPIHSFFSTKRLRTSFLLIILRKIISVVFNLRVLEKNTTKKYSKKSFEPKKSCTIEHLSCTKKIVHEKILSCTNREIVHDFFRDFEPWFNYISIVNSKISIFCHIIARHLDISMLT